MVGGPCCYRCDGFTSAAVGSWELQVGRDMVEVGDGVRREVLTLVWAMLVPLLLSSIEAVLVVAAAVVLDLMTVTAEDELRKSAVPTFDP